MEHAVGFTQVKRLVLERNDCVVRALSNATGMDYMEAHSQARELGRRENHATPWSVVLKLYERYGALHRCSTTVEQFVLDHPVGAFIVSIRRHVFAVKDGVIMDTAQSKGTRHVSVYWSMREVVDAPKRPVPKPMSLGDILARAMTGRIAPPKME